MGATAWMAVVLHGEFHSDCAGSSRPGTLFCCAKARLPLHLYLPFSACMPPPAQSVVPSLRPVVELCSEAADQRVDSPPQMLLAEQLLHLP